MGELLCMDDCSGCFCRIVGVNIFFYPVEDMLVVKQFGRNYPLVNVYITDGKITILNGKTHYFYGHFQ